jgi:hypothetical protein
MIVWLASYPRSGNTLLRVILHQAFGLTTHSRYDDMDDITPNPALAALTGHATHRLGMDAFIDAARAAPETYFVKTHELPNDDAPAIYVIRDGRAATISLWHYWQNFVPVSGPPALLDIVLGDIFCGGWSDHLFAWNPTARRDTLLLRFEQLTAGDPAAIEAIGNFLKLRQIGAASVNFEKLHGISPKFFRGGSDEKNIAELDARCRELFWLRNGPAMTAFGYASEDPYAPLSPEHRKRLCAEMTQTFAPERERFAHELAKREIDNSQLREKLTRIERSRWWRFGKKLRLTPKKGGFRPGSNAAA